MNPKSLLNCRFRSSRTWKWSHHVTEKFRRTFLRLGLRLILSKLFPFYSAPESQEFGWPNPNLRFLLFTFGASMFSLLNWARLKLSFLGIRKETTRWAGGRRSRRWNFLTQSCCYKVPEQGVFIFIFLFFLTLSIRLNCHAVVDQIWGSFFFLHKYRTETLEVLLHLIGLIFAHSFPFLFV